MIAEPPLLPGDQWADAVIGPPLAPRVGARLTGAPGVLAGETVADSAEYGLLPTPLVALTWSRYAVPLVRPVTTRLDAPAAAGRSAPTCALLEALTTLIE